PPPFSLALGLGASWLVARIQRAQVDTIEELPSSGSDPGTPTPAGSVVEAGPLPASEVDEDRIAAYPTLSVTLDMQQPLVSLGSLDLRLAERFSLASAPRVPGEDMSTFVGFADIVLGAHLDDFPVQVGVGPALGVALLRSRYDESGEGLLVGALGIVRVAVPGLPGTLDAVVRGTRLLTDSPETGSYRDAQLAYTFPL
ncbi:MAG TPA: hypothetical protein VMG12_19155, partial [Polyangiaceae bacterium]|nr:hypothetical protein [Polyangiaceae bacterium]